jgi:hypothetical protein
MTTSKVLAISGLVLGLGTIIMGFIMKNSWQICAGTYMLLWVYETYQNHKLMKMLNEMLKNASVVIKTESKDQ